jgi:hypothetical protein
MPKHMILSPALIGNGYRRHDDPAALWIALSIANDRSEVVLCRNGALLCISAPELGRAWEKVSAKSGPADPSRPAPARLAPGRPAR